MRTFKTHLQKEQAGFALLLTLVVVGVVLAIGLTMLQVTMKQLTLSNVSRESEIALYVASSGVECMQYHRYDETFEEAFLRDDNNWEHIIDDVVCGEEPDIVVEGSGLGENTYQYSYRFDYDKTCLETSLYVTDLREEVENESVNLAGNEEGLEEISCDAGQVCTTIFSRGYNRSCDNRDSILTVQRELTIQF